MDAQNVSLLVDWQTQTLFPHTQTLARRAQPYFLCLSYWVELEAALWAAKLNGWMQSMLILALKTKSYFFMIFMIFFFIFYFLFFKEHMPTNCKYYYHNTASTPQFQCTELDTFRLRKCRTIKLGAFPKSTYIVQ